MLNAESATNALLLAQTEKLTDPWQKAIYESGAQNVKLEENTLSFDLRSYDPGLKELGAYAKADDPENWLDTALQHAGIWDLKIELTLEDGLPTRKSLTSLQSSVKKAASAAEKAFSGKDIQTALQDRLFPQPVNGKIKKAEEMLAPDDSFMLWAETKEELLNGTPAIVVSAYFCSLKSKTFSGKGGPGALTMTLTGITPEALVSESAGNVLDHLAYKARAERNASGSPEELLTTNIAEEAFAALQKNSTKTILTFNVDDLISGEWPREYRTLFESFNWEETVSSLESSVERLPDEAAQEWPKAGRLSGSTKGTQVHFVISGSLDPTYIIMRDADTDEIAVTAFAVPGKKTSIRVPKGFYTIGWCSGPYWYGEEKLFGDSGKYSKSDKVEILGSSYYHTFTLESSSDGDVSVYAATPDDFR